MCVGSGLVTESKEYYRMSMRIEISKLVLSATGQMAYSIEEEEEIGGEEGAVRGGRGEEKEEDEKEEEKENAKASFLNIMVLFVYFRPCINY
jgi:hypothetical protein